jgi:hypothetical protein
MDSNNAAQANENQDCSQPMQPTAQHQWLQQLVGEWTMDSEMTMPDGSKSSSTGTEKVIPLGKLWIIAKMRSGMGDGNQMDGRMQVGYNGGKGTFEGSFIADMMDFQWVYSSGELEGDTLTLRCVGPNMAPGAEPGSTSNYRDVIEVTDKDHRTLRSFAETANGWMQFMEARYTRVG